MNAIFVYALEVNFSLFIFFAIYWLFLKNERYFHFNRFLILGLIALSFLIPFIDFQSSEPVSFVADLDTVVISAKQTAISTPLGLNLPSFLSLSYLMGALVALGILFKQGLHLHRLTNKASKEKFKNVALLRDEQINSPGSFFNQIFWTSDIRPAHQAWIMEHEMVHVNEAHSIDVIAIRLAQIACWFNPAIYLFKSELEATHEFRADQIVSDQAKDKQTYSEILLGQALDVDYSALTHHFSKSNLLKRRIIMLNKKQNKGQAILKYALLVPVILGVLAFHSCTKESRADGNENTQEGKSITQQEGKMVEGKDDVFVVVDQMPEYPGGKDAFMQFLGENIQYPENCKEDAVEGTVIVGFVIDELGNATDIEVINSPDDRLSASALEVVAKMQAWTPGKHKGKNVKVQYKLPIRYEMS